MVFKLYECDLSITYKGITYKFTHVDSMQIEDPERTRLVRGANAGDKSGLSYKEGLKDAKTITVNVLDIPMDMHNLLKSIYDAADRVDVNCISRKDGSAKLAKNAVLSQSPKQLTLDDSAESLNVALAFESYDVSEVKKS